MKDNIEEHPGHYLCLLCRRRFRARAPAGAIPTCLLCGLETPVKRIVGLPQHMKAYFRAPEIEEHIRKHLGRQSVAEMARRLKVSNACVYNHMRRLGLTNTYPSLASRRQSK